MLRRVKRDSATHAQKEICKLSADVFHPKPLQIPLCRRVSPALHFHLNSASYIKRPLNLFLDVLSQSQVQISHAQEENEPSERSNVLL